MNSKKQNLKLISTITTLLLFFIPLSLLANYLNGRESFAILYFFMFFAALKHYFCFKKEQDSAKASEQILIILLGLYFSFFLIGEQKTFDVLWGLIIPTIAVMTASLKRLKFWLLSTISLTLVMIFVAAIYPHYIRYELFPLFSLLWALIFISYMAYQYKLIRTTLEEELYSYQNSLEEKVKESTSKISELNKNLDETQTEILEKLATVGEYHSKEKSNNLSRIGQYVKELAKLYGLEKEKYELFERAAPLHDIGEVGIDEAIINKAGKLNAHEFQKMKEHTTIGETILGGSDKALLQIATEMAGAHHEQYDGNGYPKNLKGENIPLSARILAIADVFDALYSDTSYKKNWTNEDIISHFKNERGKSFDPELTDIFLANFEEFISIYEMDYINTNSKN